MFDKNLSDEKAFNYLFRFSYLNYTDELQNRMQ